MVGGLEVVDNVDSVDGVAMVVGLTVVVRTRLGVVVIKTVDEVVVDARRPIDVRLLLGRPLVGWTMGGAVTGGGVVVETCCRGLVARCPAFGGGLFFALVVTVWPAFAEVCCLLWSSPFGPRS